MSDEDETGAAESRGDENRGIFPPNNIRSLTVCEDLDNISAVALCQSEGQRGFIIYSTVRGEGAEKYRTSGRPLWTEEGGCNRLNIENEGGPGNFSWDVK